ncbi:MAG: hypothetical protein IPJ98_22105 [Bryobacterales bacterium]|nr:hypothetical protein [Bryobacterales bacterium]
MSRLSFGETKSCCHIAYDGLKGQRYRFWDGSIWEVIDAWATSLSGFKALAMRPQAMPGRVVLAFAGTDSIRDVIADGAQVVGILPIQYPQALGVTNRCRRLYPSLQLCGHSLGGGLAAYSSVQTRLDASTINPAPLVAGAGLSALFGSNQQIVNYIAGGSEVVSSSPGRNPGRDVAVPGSGNFFTRHMLSNTDPSVALPVQA